LSVGRNPRSRPVIEACVINTNNSQFAELAARSLIATHAAAYKAADLRLTLLDNHSTDKGLDDLRAGTTELGVIFEQTRWPIASASTNTHGDVLRDFVISRRDADYYLFVDSDIVFEKVGSVWTMLRELSTHTGLWAVQARFRNLEEARGPGSSLDISAGRGQRVWWRFEPVPPGRHKMKEELILGEDQARCHTACTLITNSAPFQLMCNIIGLSSVVVISQDSERAGLYDTLAMGSLIMKTHGLNYALSEAQVLHYFGMSYRDDPEVADAVKDCNCRLDVLRRNQRIGSSMPSLA